MTRDEAIINLKLSQNRIGGIKKEEWNALQMAIEALSAEAVSREWYDDAIKANHELAFTDLPDVPRYYYEKVVGKMAHEINMLKEQLESADAVQGEWIDREHCQVDEDAYEIATCSHCKAEITLEYPNDNFCPNCGARMKGGAE